MGKEAVAKKTVNAKLFVRILPTLDFSHDSIKIESNKKVLHVRCLQDFSKSKTITNPNYWSFSTDGIFWNMCQDEIYKTVTEDLIDNVLNGISGMVMALGQSGSGKSFTMLGLRLNFENRGIALRILSKLFEERERQKDTKRISYSISYCQFLGEKVKDLLGDKPVNNFRSVRKISLNEEPESWDQVFIGESRKTFYDSAPYEGSNRGHSVLTIHVESESLIDTDPCITHSKLHLVDLSGVDSIGSTSSIWKRKEDLGYSNLTKSSIEQLMLCLTGEACTKCSTNSRKLLNYLHDSMQPNCVMRFISHIHGTDENLPITLSVLRLGDVIQDLKPSKLERNVEANVLLYMKALEKEVKRLKGELELSDMLRDSPNYSNISQEKLQQVRRAAEAYLQNELENLTLLSLGQANLTLEVFRDFHQKFILEKDQAVKDAVATATEEFQSQEKGGSISQIKASRRRSTRQQDPQAIRTSESSQILSARNMIASQVGVTDKKGIGIGPGKMTANYEGNITKAYKKLRSRKSDSVVRGTRSGSVNKNLPLSSNNFASDSQLNLPDTVPSRETAWQEFFNQKTESLSEVQDNIEKLQEEAKQKRKFYMTSIADLARERGEFERYEAELHDCQHLQAVYGKEIEDEDGNFIMRDAEKKLMDAITKKKEEVNEALEKCHVALVDFKNAVEDLNEARRNLENTFQNFCKEFYKVNAIPEDLSSETNQTPLEEVISDSELLDRVRAETFQQLQYRLFNAVPKYPKKKWENIF